MSEGMSVIICCYNSAPRLPRTLEHLALQHTPSLPWEIVLVDNRSTDDTRRTAVETWSRLGRHDVPLHVVDQPVPGLSYARQKGVEASRYALLLFCDDDNWLSPNYVEDAFRILHARADIGALGGTGQAVADVPLPSWFEAYKACFACYPQGKQEGELSGTNAFLYGAGLVVRRDALDRLAQKQFKPILPDRVGSKLSSGGDTELSYALRLTGYKLWYSEKLMFQHHLPASRLTEQYLYRLVSALAYCSGLLITYNYLLEGKKITSLTWIKDTLYQFTFLLRALVSYPFTKQAVMEKNLGVLFSWNKFKSIVAQAGAYGSRDRQIRKLIE